MVVDALVVYGSDAERRDTGICFQQGGRVTDHVLDEDRVVEGLHGDVAFVRAFEQCVDWRRPGALGHINEFFDPYQLPSAIRFRLGSDFQGHVSPLVVRPVIADLLAARAEGCDGHGHSQGKLILDAIRSPQKGAIASDLGRRTGHRCLLGDEVGEGHLDVGFLRIKTLFQVVEDGGKRVHGYLALVNRKHLQEPTHVGALEVVGQMDRHRDHRDRREGLALTVQNLDRVTEV